MDKSVYPPNFLLEPKDSIRRAMELIKDKEAIDKAFKFVDDNHAQMDSINNRLITLVTELVDGPDVGDPPQLLGVREIGKQLYDIGGYLVMKITCDSLADMYDTQRTAKGNRYRFAVTCNMAWSYIGEWVG